MNLLLRKLMPNTVWAQLLFMVQFNTLTVKEFIYVFIQVRKYFNRNEALEVHLILQGNHSQELKTSNEKSVLFTFNQMFQ